MQCGIKIRKTHRIERLFIQTMWIFLPEHQISFLKHPVKTETRSGIQNVFHIEKLNMLIVCFIFQWRCQ